MIIRVLAGLLAASLLLTGLQSYRLVKEQAEHADTKTQHAEQLRELSDTALQATKAAREEEQRRTAEVQKAADEANEALARSRADAVAASDAGQRLRNRLATLTASCGRATSYPGPSGSGTSAVTTADLLADVQRRLDAATDRIAAHADAARAAGLACERIHDAIKW